MCVHEGNMRGPAMTQSQEGRDSSSEDPNGHGSGRKEKLRASRKVVVRRLPPTMTQEDFLQQVSPLPENDYFCFVKADMTYGTHAYTRAYINFFRQEDMITFWETFDGYVFVDQKGHEYPAVIELAPFQKVPRARNRKKDGKSGTAESDPEYQAFLENIKSPEEVVSATAESLLEEIEARERELKGLNGAGKLSTPLLEYIRQRKQERLRLREDRREEKRRKDLERRRLREEERRRKKLLKKPIKEEEEGEEEGGKTERFKEKNKDRERDIGKKKVKKVEEKIKEEAQRSEKPVEKSVPTGVSSEEKQIGKGSERREEEKKNEEKSAEKEKPPYVEPRDQTRQERDREKERREKREKRLRNKDRPAMEIYRPPVRRQNVSGSSPASASDKGEERDSTHHSPVPDQPSSGKMGPGGERGKRREGRGWKQDSPSGPHGQGSREPVKSMTFRRSK
ncbi:unnamed protein product [Darwinula stevensoni]|uniref:UPF3 domain-containing protein n=1 Tax=Darwinula stevensoni TaxID=69355 RepID=A0A7R8X6M2_9CRUS|nr:unnamed protein product [Darwinula stevensoni]CAG0887003.1 unnamed protein product [Darwinula stevensoni]